MKEIGRVEAIYRYPVKSMRGERLDNATMGWHGLEGDRRLALRKVGDQSGFPWLSASKLPDLITFAPHLPTHVLTPEGRELPLFGDELADDIEQRCGMRVEMLRMKHGAFDEAHISVIATDTIDEICRLAGNDSDARRFRPNIVVRLAQPAPFCEDDWVGSVLRFGEGDNAPAVAVTMLDLRCSMINIDPDSGARDPEVLKVVARMNETNAGVYCVVNQTGEIKAGQPIFLDRPVRSASPR